MTHESEDLPGMVALVLPEENCAMVKTTTGLAGYTDRSGDLEQAPELNLFHERLYHIRSSASHAGPLRLWLSGKAFFKAI